MAGLGLDTTSDIIPSQRKKKTRLETAQVALLVAMIVFFTYSVISSLYLLEVGKPLINMHR
ncbi:MAG TPA: hypothetical protein VFA68_02740 [Terriglobales bacterium]|nr:hypothetical protein [Terriglobales bacterium]